MGMFDDIICEAPLPEIPGVPHPGDSFQSKDFDCELNRYTITADGKLVGANGPIDFHGWLDFYHFDTKTDMWWNYRAKFTDGQLQKIELVEVYKQSGTGCVWLYPLSDTSSSPQQESK